MLLLLLRINPQAPFLLGFVPTKGHVLAAAVPHGASNWLLSICAPTAVSSSAAVSLWPMNIVYFRILVCMLVAVEYSIAWKGGSDVQELSGSLM